MSEFDEAMSEAFTDLSDVLGTVEFTIGGMAALSVAGAFVGILGEETAERRELEEGGHLQMRSATLLAARAQFPAEPPLNARLTVAGGKVYRILRVGADAGSFAITLGEVDR